MTQSSQREDSMLTHLCELCAFARNLLRILGVSASRRLKLSGELLLSPVVVPDEVGEAGGGAGSPATDEQAGVDQPDLLS